MGEVTRIEWADATFNAWMGCEKISEGCADCYAVRSTPVRHARAQGRELWGKDGLRQRTSESNWNKVLLWNKKARIAGTRPRVFVNSLADVFENRPDLHGWRSDLFQLIEQCKHLDFLLVTKRVELVMLLVPDRWLNGFPSNVWMLTTAENQARFDQRIRHLLRIPAHVHGVSLEPLIGPITLGEHAERLDWVIVGGESGANARPMAAEWARSLRDECKRQGSALAFHFKQWGEYDEAGVRVGKKAAGRLLDGRTWDELPIAGDLAGESADRGAAEDEDCPACGCAGTIKEAEREIVCLHGCALKWHRHGALRVNEGDYSPKDVGADCPYRGDKSVPR